MKSFREILLSLFNLARMFFGTVKQWKLFKLCSACIFSPSEYLIDFYFCCSNPHILNFIYGRSESNSYLIVSPKNERWQFELLHLFQVKYFIVLAFSEILLGSNYHFVKIKSATSFNIVTALLKTQINSFTSNY